MQIFFFCYLTWGRLVPQGAFTSLTIGTWATADLACSTITLLFTGTSQPWLNFNLTCETSGHLLEYSFPEN